LPACLVMCRPQKITKCALRHLAEVTAIEISHNGRWYAISLCIFTYDDTFTRAGLLLPQLTRRAKSGHVPGFNCMQYYVVIPWRLVTALGLIAMFILQQRRMTAPCRFGMCPGVAASFYCAVTLVPCYAASLTGQIRLLLAHLAMNQFVSGT
jgi:hypothetical protein